ncbi:MAG TPA: alpha/beta fold hydrolase [Gemmataceae bacterium]|nr:alpha/beta fold hydrolase [Gemmataceae bacterium]
MRWFRPGLLTPAVLAGLLSILSPGTAYAQKAAAPVPVEFPTADSVTLKGHWYPSGQGKEAPVVLLLHAFGEDSKKTEWLNLAKALQERGYAVLRFDFRGHGDSDTIFPGIPNPTMPKLSQPGFWDQKENQAGLRTFVASPKIRKVTTISFKDFKPDYHRILANDIAAAKVFLDEKNDAGECNTSNLILIGVKEGATLAALWLNGEYSRYRMLGKFQVVPAAGGTLKILGGQPDTTAGSEGKCVTAAVWLSLSPTLGDKNVNPGAMLRTAGGPNKVPMLFLYGKGEGKGKQASEGALKTITKGNNPKDFPFTLAYEVSSAAADKLSGVQLLQKPLGMVKEITGYLDKAQEGKNPKWKVRQDKTDTYAWVINGQPYPLVSRPNGTLMPLFSRYVAFLHYQ